MLYPLTKPQYLIYEMEKHIGGSIANIVGGMLCSSLTVQQLEGAVKEVLQANEGLRIRLIEKEYNPYQYVEPYEEEISQHIIKHKTFSSKEKMDDYFVQEAAQPFEQGDYLCRFYIVTVEGKVGCIAKLHHMISDAWTIVLLGNQIISRTQEGSITEDESISYRAYIEDEKEYINSKKYQKAKDYWLDQFLACPEAVYLSEQHESNYKSSRVSFKVSQELVELMKAYCISSRCSIYSLMMSAMGIYMARIKGKERFYLGTAILNRSGKKEKHTVGMFVNTAAVLMDVEGDYTFNQVVKQTGLKTLEVFRHQKYQYGEVLKDLRQAYQFKDKLYDVMISYQNVKIESQELQENIWYPCGMQNESLEIHIHDRENKGEISIDYDYQVDKFSGIEIQEVHEHLTQIIREGIQKDVRIRHMQILTDDVYDKLIHTLNQTKCFYPKDQTIIELFKKQVEQTPHAIALQHKDELLTYRMLDQQSERVAKYLMRIGVRPQSIVGLFLPRSVSFMVSVLAVLKLGGAYLPIDAHYPRERVEYMLKDSQASTLITTSELRKNIVFEGRVITDLSPQVDEYEDMELPTPKPKDLIYVIYTSGSTGNPKGVMLTHQSVVHYISWAKKVYLKNEPHDFPLFTSISFDLTVTSLFTPLITGNRIVIYEDELGPQAVLKVFKDNQVGIVKLTPTHLKLIINQSFQLSRIKRLIVGGEQLECFCAKKVTECFSGEIEIYNEYGPTEATVGCMIYQYNPHKDNGYAVPIGSPSDNMSIYVLDKWLNPVPYFVKGEMYIAGEGIAKGYLGNETLTRAKFIENPFGEGLMYKTGDIAVRDKTGTIIYCGRIDDQVKIRGHRIELGEIEDKLIKHLNLQQVVVRIIEEDHDKYLCAYYVANEEISASYFRKTLKPYLPDYMIPTYYQQMESIPMTINGKVDSGRLPEPQMKRNQATYVAPQTDKEKQIIKVFEDVLGMAQIGMEDSFLSLGGDSIKAIQIVSRLNDMGIKMDSKDILNEDFMTAIVLKAKENQETSYNQDIIDGQIAHTPIMKWFEKQHFINPNYYGQTITLTLPTPIQHIDLQTRFNEMIRHFDTLRLNKNQFGYYYNNGLLDKVFKIDEVNVADDLYFKEKCVAMKKQITLEEDFPLKACVFTRGEERLLVITAHHLVTDGITWRLLVDFLMANKEGVTVKKTASFKDWAAYLNHYGKASSVTKEIKFWNKMQHVQLLFTNAREGLSLINNKRSMARGYLSKDLTIDLLEKSNKAYNTKVEELLVCSLLKTLKDWYGETTYTLELEGHGRGLSDMDVSSTAGWFTAIYPVKFDFNKQQLKDQIIQVKDQLRQVKDGGIGYGVLKYLENVLEPSEAPEIRFNYLGTSDFEGYKMLDTGPEVDEMNESYAKLDINCMVCEQQLVYWFEYDKKYFSQETIEGLMDCFHHYLSDIVNLTIEQEVVEYTATDFDITTGDFEELFM